MFIQVVFWHAYCYLYSIEDDTDEKREMLLLYLPLAIGLICFATVKIIKNVKKPESL